MTFYYGNSTSNGGDDDDESDEAEAREPKRDGPTGRDDSWFDADVEETDDGREILVIVAKENEDARIAGPFVEVKQWV